MPEVFTRLSVFPILNGYTLVDWEVHPDFNLTGPYTFTVQMSRSGTPNGNDWVDVAKVQQTTLAAVSIADTENRRWSVAENWFYRVLLSLPNGDLYQSNSEPAWGSLTKQDSKLLTEIYRQACLRFRTNAGSKGLLFKRKHWGARDYTTIDPDTLEIVNSESETDYGTGFLGGYWQPTPYWLEVGAGDSLRITDTNVGTDATRIETAKAISWPLPRTKDMWYNCTTGKRYEIGRVTTTSKIRSVPATLALELIELPPTDIAYKVPVPVGAATLQAPTTAGSNWFTNYWL